MSASANLDLLPDSLSHRRTMVDCQIRTFDVTDQNLIARFLDIPREIFLPETFKDLAYSDRAIEVSNGNGQRQLLPPLVLARLMQGALIKPSDKILDIASGTGYSTAILAGLGSEVTSLESDAGFASLIESNLKTCGVPVHLEKGPLAGGASKNAPFDVIFINGAVEAELETLFSQLKEGGRLLTIQRTANDSGGKAVRFEKGRQGASACFLFDASAPLLTEFKKAPQFTF